jgi:hypothetical protein
VLLATPGTESIIQEIYIMKADGTGVVETKFWERTNPAPAFPHNTQGDTVTVPTPGGYVLKTGDVVKVSCNDGGTT